MWNIERMKQTVDKFSTFLDKEYLNGIWGLTLSVMHPDFLIIWTLRKWE